MALGQVMVYIIDYSSYIPMVSIIFNNISNFVPKKKDLKTEKSIEYYWHFHACAIIGYSLYFSIFLVTI